MARILLAEDEANVYALLSQRLHHLGHEVTWAQDGRQTLEAIQRQPPDLLLLDVVMPEINGLQVLREIKTNEETRGIPVIMLTVRGHHCDVTDAFESGADDYIVKPFSFPELIARVNTLLARYAA